MYLDNDPKKKKTKLKKGDRCFLRLSHGTFAFQRGSERLMHDVDDKFLISDISLTAAEQLLRMLADTHGLSVSVWRQIPKKGFYEYRFE
jgi:hypothetical protein